MRPFTLTVLVAGLALASVACPDPVTSSTPDASRADAATHDAAQTDAAAPNDASVADSALNDAASAGDASPADAATIDATTPDTGAMDASPVDATTDPPDADDSDSGTPQDSGSPDAGPPVDEDRFTMRVVALDLDMPWEITWGPDSRLWITERAGKRVLRVHPLTGAQTTALEVTDAYQVSGQDGVLGMALDPKLGQSNGGDYVYLAYTYDADLGSEVDRRTKIVRYTYDAGSQTLGSPLVLIDELPASGDHNSGRLVYGPDHHLYYTIGDQGRNQFDSMCLPNRAQDLPTLLDVNQEDWSAYQGKILRLALDGSIPLDNPLLAGVRSHVYTYGHRNAQGIAFGPSGKLYASEQGPKTDDEINLIVGGKNYGWPYVAGYRDDEAYVYGNWSAASPEPCENLAFSDYGWPASVPEQLESEWSSSDFTPPLMTFFTVDTGFDFMDPACAGNEFICWPTIAPSSLDLYAPGGEGLQTWGTSLLMTSLKTGSVFRVRLSADGETTVGSATELFKTTNRYRDLTIAPDKRTFYVVTDAYGFTSGPTSGSTQELEHRGAILEFTPASN